MALCRLLTPHGWGEYLRMGADEVCSRGGRDAGAQALRGTHPGICRNYLRLYRLRIPAARRGAHAQLALDIGCLDRVLHDRDDSLRLAVPVWNDLKVLRAQRSWTQARLAEELGVSRQTVNALEAGRYDPSLPLAFTIARVFGLTIEEIFFPDDDAS